MIRTHGPILKTVAAAFSVLVAASALRFDLLAETTLSAPVLLSFLLGLFYTQLFEFWAHRIPMHRRVRYLEDVRRNHLEHHAVFHGDNFRTRRPEDLRHIAGRWWVFPVLFGLHYFPAVALLPFDAATAFLCGCVLHYVAFEVTHWLTHVEDNAVDRILQRVPVLGGIRSFQIEHHRAHHEVPLVAFNFNPPYLGDRLARSMGRPVALPPAPAPLLPLVLPAPAPVLLKRRFLSQQIVRCGAAAAVGVVALGLVVFAHGRLSRHRREAVPTIKT